MSNVSEGIFKTIFNPQSIAVFGASSNEAKSGTRYLKALIEVGYPGRLYPINPKDQEILGQKAYASIRDCPEPVDYAMFCVPAHHVPDLVEDCGANGIKAMQLFTAGFKESGEADGIELENRMVRIARRHGIRIIGPNCIGIYCPESRIPYGMGASPMEPGNVGFLSQSGGHAGRLVFGGFMQGIRFSKVISYGNGCDLDAVDFMKFLGSDQNTGVIGAYIEGMENVRPFYELTRRISKEKPIVIQEHFDRMTDLFGREAFQSFFTELLDLGEKSKTVFPLIWPPETSTPEGISLRLKLIEKGLTVYPSARRAARAISNVIQYKKGKSERI
jgi:acetyltransferase